MHESLVSRDDCIEVKNKRKRSKVRKEGKRNGAEEENGERWKRVRRTGRVEFVGGMDDVAASRERQRERTPCKAGPGRRRGQYGGGEGKAKKVRPTAENQLAIALSRRSATRSFERAWRNVRTRAKSGGFRRRTG